MIRITNNTQTGFWNWEKIDKDDHAFIIAVILIVGFIVLLVITLYKDSSLTKELAGIFSGWIVAIVGFYFMRNQASQAGEMAQKIGQKEGKSAAEEFGSTYEELEDVYKELNAKYITTSNNLQRMKEEYIKLRKAYQGS